MRKIAALIFLIVAACAYFLFMNKGAIERARSIPVAALTPVPDTVSVEISDTTWAEIMAWEFSDGWFPEGWGWGKWEIREGLLVGEDPRGDMAVYFLPFVHGENVMLETRVKLLRSAGGTPVEVHLLTRDDKSIHYESGLVLRAGANAVDVRHMLDYDDCIRKSVAVDSTTQYDRWYLLRFLFHGGKVDAYVDDEHVYASATDATVACPQAEEETVYTEPHVAVYSGAAAFEYVKIFAVSRAASGDSTGAAVASAVTTDRPIAFPSSAPRQRHWIVKVLLWMLYAVIFLVCVYIVRHYVFTLNRLFGRQRQPYLDVDAADWPDVTVVIPAHNEEMVIGDVLEAMLDVDYPGERLTILAVNDRSKDTTEKIIDDFARRCPDRIKPFHRREGAAGKAAALNDATKLVETDIMLVFDADYVPGKGLVKQLVAPFFDPEVGAVMGRVVPYNVHACLLTRLLDLERAGGYQVDQQARMNLKAVPQYGGTVGGVRKKALLAVGGWREDSLAEDTDATYRLLLGGWKTVYQNRSECYEQVPEKWTSRLRQIMRWAKGHNQTAVRYVFSLLRNRRTGWQEKLDGILLLGVYFMSPILLLGWALGIVLWYLGEPRSSLIIILAVTSYSTLGNFAVFFEIAAATQLDGSRQRIRLLPFVFLGFLVSLFSVARATFSHVAINGNGKNGKNGKNGEVVWDKTERNNNFNGTNGNGKHTNGGRSDP